MAFDDEYEMLENQALGAGPSEVTFVTDFSGGVPSEISGSGVLTSVQSFAGIGNGTNVFADDFLRNTSVGDPAPSSILSLTELPPHSSIDVNFLLGLIDSWDGSRVDFGPDYFNVSVDDEILFSETMVTESDWIGSYSPPENVLIVNDIDLGFGNRRFQLEGALDMGFDPAFDAIDHRSDTLTIEWFASGAAFPGSVVLGDARALSAFAWQRQPLRGEEGERVGWVMFGGVGLRDARQLEVTLDLGAGPRTVRFMLPERR